MVKFYLGRPPYKIEEWIKTHTTSKLSDPLCFTAQQANSTVRLDGDWSSSGSSDPYGSDPYGSDPYGGGGSAYRINLEYKLEGSTNKDWSRYTGQNITLANVNDKMYMRATSEGNRTLSEDGSNNYYFQMAGKIAASGNIQTLLDQTGNRTDVPAYCYRFMFYNCSSLTQAPELPATTLAYNCYDGMFQKCSSLTQAPELPATKLTYYCYQNMFQDCKSLTQAPKLPATTLAQSCYSSMFQGCTSLTQAPKLPATTLATWCYRSMFDGCTSLTQAPELPATILANWCYYTMFQDCTSLTQAPELPATTLTTNCYYYMFNNCPKFSTVKMKSTMSGKYNTATHGNLQKEVEYVL